MNIRDWRLSKGLTQQQCADAFGISQATLSKIECGSSVPAPRTARRIEAATNGEVNAAELLCLNADGPRAIAAGPHSRSGVREAGLEFKHEDATVSVSVPGHLSRAASDLGVDVENKLREGGLPALRQAITDAFLERHKAEIEWTREYLEKHGTLSQQFGMI